MGLAVESTMSKTELQEAIDAAEASPEETERVCVNCGEPATQRSTNPATNEVYYCDRHSAASGEPVASLTNEPVTDEENPPQ